MTMMTRDSVSQAVVMAVTVTGTVTRPGSRVAGCQTRAVESDRQSLKGWLAGIYWLPGCLDLWHALASAKQDMTIYCTILYNVSKSGTT
jgi:hypothetical protein